MADYGPFLAVTLLTLVLLLVLARLSQDFLEEYTGEDEKQVTVEDEEVSEEERVSSPDLSEEGVADEFSSPKQVQSSDQSPGQSGHTSPRSDDTPPRPGESTAPGVPGSTASEFPESSDDEFQGRPDEEFDDPPGVGEPDRDLREEIELTPAALMANVALTQVFVVAVLVGAAWYFDIPAAAFGITGESISTGVSAVAVGVTFGAVLWVANELSTTLADAVGAAYDERVREMLAPESAQGWIVLFGVVLPIIAVGEELLFRAALIGVPEMGYGINVWLLAVLSSVAFALGHGAQGRVGVIVTGALGLVLAAGYVVTGSLLVVVVAHYVINALEFFVHEFAGYGDIFSGRLTAVRE